MSRMRAISSVWDLEDGLRLIRAIQMESREYGYHLTLGGGVLNNGRSEKDIDLYFLPLNNPRMKPENPDGLLEWLSGMWGMPNGVGGDYPDEGGPDDQEARDDDDDPPDEDNEGGPPLDGPVQVAPIAPPKPHRVYKMKLRFVRADGTQIDAFVL